MHDGTQPHPINSHRESNLLRERLDENHRTALEASACVQADMAHESCCHFARRLGIWILLNRSDHSLAVDPATTPVFL
jgi:hypothetical protein